MKTNEDYAKLEGEYIDLMRKYVELQRKTKSLSVPTNTLPDRLHIAICEKGCTQKALAAACGVTPSAVGQWRGSTTKSIDAVNALHAAAFLGVRVEWLILGEGGMK